MTQESGSEGIIDLKSQEIHTGLGLVKQEAEQRQATFICLVQLREHWTDVQVA